MEMTVGRAGVVGLGDVVAAVASWQVEGAPVQVHPGDLGWNFTMGAARLADEVVVWHRNGEIVAVGMGDGDVVRMAVSPAACADAALAAQIVDDLSIPARGVLAVPCEQVEVRFGDALHRRLASAGWTDDEPWTPLHRSLIAPVKAHGLRIEIITRTDADPALVRDRIDAHRSAFPSSKLTLERWRAMAESPAYRTAQCLVGYDDGAAVAATTVWSAGTGRPGLIEPLGVHRDHRGRGHGRAITLAAAHALQVAGASSVTVCTRSANEPGVAAYESAGFTRLAAVTDFRRPQASQ